TASGPDPCRLRTALIGRLDERQRPALVDRVAWGDVLRTVPVKSFDADAPEPLDLGTVARVDETLQQDRVMAQVDRLGPAQYLEPTADGLADAAHVQPVR